MKTPFLVFACVVLVALTSVHVAHAATPTVPECLSASEASIKLRSEHRLRLATAQLLTCLSATCPGEVAQECARRMDRVTAAIPTIVFEVKDVGGHELSAVKVTMDGEVVADHLDGSALTLDPGSHKFTFETAGQPTTTQEILLHEGDKNRHIGVVLANSPPQQPVAAADATETPAPGHGRRVMGLVVGSVGVAGVVLGGILGGLQLSEVSTTKSACPTGFGCSSQALSDRSLALTYGNASTGAFIAGGLFVAGGLTLYFTAPKGVTQTVGVQVGPGMLAVKGSF